MTDKKNEELNVETDESLDFNNIETNSNDIEALGNEYNEELKKELGAAEETKEVLDTETIEEAKKFGHQSLEQWTAAGKDPGKWKSEKDFVNYGREYKQLDHKLKSLEQQNIQYSKKIDILVEAQKRKEEETVFQAKKQLETELKQALDFGNVEAVRVLTEEKVRQDIVQQNKQIDNMTQEIKRVDDLFIQRNAFWFNQSRPELVAEVQEIANMRRASFPNEPYIEKARMIESEMKFRHPDLNVSTQSHAPVISASDSAVIKSEGTSKSSDDRLLKSLSAEERAEYNVLKNRLGGSKLNIKYTVKEYIDSKHSIENRGY